MIFSIPAELATYLAPTTPPAGPESTDRAACLTAVSTPTTPPLLCIRENGRGDSPSDIRRRYLAINGAT